MTAAILGNSSELRCTKDPAKLKTLSSCHDTFTFKSFPIYLYLIKHECSSLFEV